MSEMEQVSVVERKVHIWNQETTGADCGEMNAMNIHPPSSPEVNCQECLHLNGFSAPAEQSKPSLEEVTIQLNDALKECVLVVDAMRDMGLPSASIAMSFATPALAAYAAMKESQR